MENDFTPSQVYLDYIPFLDTFNKTECEVTAAVMVKALAIEGDEWRVIDCTDLARVFGELTAEEGYWRKLFNNPFLTIDMHGLVKRGFAEWREDGKAIEFTEKGRLRMAKWVRRDDGPGPGA